MFPRGLLKPGSPEQISADAAGRPHRQAPPEKNEQQNIIPTIKTETERTED